MKLALVSIFTCLVAGGCATRHGRVYPIFGFGWVEIGTNTPTVTAAKTTLLGVGGSSFPPSGVIGYSKVTYVTAATNSNVNLEIK